MHDTHNTYAIVKPDIHVYAAHLVIFNEKAHNFERRAIEIDRRKKSNILHSHIIIFHSEKFTRTKTDFLRKCIMGNVDIISLLLRILRLPLTIF